jgi:hypothetical protein
MPKKVRKTAIQLELPGILPPPQPKQQPRTGLCNVPHPEFGEALACRLQHGHKGAHSSMTGPDEHWT